MGEVHADRTGVWLGAARLLEAAPAPHPAHAAGQMLLADTGTQALVLGASGTDLLPEDRPFLQLTQDTLNELLNQAAMGGFKADPLG
jgi:hypothetical protein